MVTLHWSELLVAGVYLLLLIIIGVSFRCLSSNADDYFRAGCRGTWWLVGGSIFMANFSAMTFVAIAGQSFVAGWSPLLITAGGVVINLLYLVWLAPKFRQMRVTSNGDVMYLRFGRAAEQFVSYYGLIGGLLGASLALVGTATFVSTIWGLPLWLLIVAVGIVITVYSSFAGSWGILATDFVQGAILVPLTVAVAILSIVEIGGVGELFSRIDQLQLTADFALLKESGHVYRTPVALTPGLFTWEWFFGLAFLWFAGATSIGAKFTQVKDGREARKTAALVVILLALGSSIWYIPPIVARLLYYSDVMAVKDIANAADASYAVISTKLLPTGLIGLLCMAILSATMSSLDSSFNGVSAMVVRNIYPPLAARYGLPRLESPANQLLFSRTVNAIYGSLIIVLGLYLAHYGAKEGLYSIMLKISALIGFPAAVPLMMAMLVRRVPGWGYFLSFGFGLLGGIVGFFLPEIQHAQTAFYLWSPLTGALAAGLSWWATGHYRRCRRLLLAGGIGAIALGFPILLSELQGTTFQLYWQRQLFLIGGLGMFGWLLACCGWHAETPDAREKINGFYARMEEAVDFDREVGSPNDFRQFKMVGFFVLLSGGLLASLLLLDNPASGRMTILAIVLFVLSLGLLLYRLGCRGYRNEQRAAPRQSADSPAPQPCEE